MKYLISIRALFLFTLVVLLSTPGIAQRNKKGGHSKKTKEEIRQEVEYIFIEAEKLFILQNYSQATELYNKCLELDPNNDVVYYKLAEINSNTEQYSIADLYISKALAINKSNKYYYLLGIDIESNLGNLKKASEYYEALILEVPKTDRYLFNLAALYIYQQEYNLALTTYNRAEKVFGLTEDISIQRQKVYLQQNKLDEAIEESKRLLKTYPDNPRYVLLLVEILSSNNRLTEAITELNSLLEKKPEFSAARLQLADIYWKQNNFSGFSDELVIAFNDKDLNLNAKINTLMKYMAYLPSPTLEKQIPILTGIITEKHSDNANAYLIAGDVYSSFLEKQLVPDEDIPDIQKKAAISYSRYVNIDPSNFSVWQNLLNLELQLNLEDSLAKHADQALVLFPNQAWVYLVNGIVKQNQDDLQASAQMFEMGSKRSASNQGLLVVFYSYLGDTYYELKEYDKSDKAYDSALELDPLNYTVLNNYSYYLSLRNDKMEKARQMSKTLIRNNPNNNTYLDTYAWVNYIIGDYEEAHRIFEKIIASGVDQGVYYDHYGDTLFKLGKTDEALVQWIKAKELDKNIENIDKKINQRKIIQ